MILGSYGVDQVCSLRKILMRLSGTHLCTSAARFAPSFVSQPNRLKCTQIVWNAPKCQFSSYKVDRVHSLPKIPTRLRGTNFCTSSACIAPSFVRQPNGPECTPMVRNTPKRQFRFKWGGSGVRCEKFWRDFVARTFALVRPVLHVVR